MRLSERIKKLVEYSGMNTSQYAFAIGAKTPQAIRDLISGKTKTLSADMQEKIISYSPQINLSWLLTGEGEMLRYSVDNSDAINVVEETELVHAPETSSARAIPLINIDSVGGIHSQNIMTASEQYVMRMIVMPGARKGDVAILQSGTSMAPTIPAGAILQIRRVEGWREYFGYGNDFVLWLTDDRRITKQVLKYSPDPKNYVTCHSYNPEVEDEELPKSMIQEVWKVINVLINKGW